MYKVVGRYSNGYTIPAYQIQDERNNLKAVLRKDFAMLCILHKVSNCRVIRGKDGCFKFAGINCKLTSLPVFKAYDNLESNLDIDLLHQTIGKDSGDFTADLLDLNRKVAIELVTFDCIHTNGDIQHAVNIRKEQSIFNKLPFVGKKNSNAVVDNYFETYEKAAFSDDLLKDIDNFFGKLTKYSPEQCLVLYNMLYNFSPNIRFVMNELPCSKVTPESMAKTIHRRHKQYFNYLKYDDFYCKCAEAQGKRVISVRHVLTAEMLKQKPWKEERKELGNKERENIK